MTQVRPTRLDDRYGRVGRRRRGRITAVAGAAVALVVLLAWALWSGIGGVTTSLDTTTTGYTLHADRSVTVRWLVTGRADTRLICAIQAEDSNGVVLGLVEQVVPVTGSDLRSGTTEVRTTREAVTGLIDSCRDA